MPVERSEVTNTHVRGCVSIVPKFSSRPRCRTDGPCRERERWRRRAGVPNVHPADRSGGSSTGHAELMRVVGSTAGTGEPTCLIPGSVACSIRCGSCSCPVRLAVDRIDDHWGGSGVAVSRWQPEASTVGTHGARAESRKPTWCPRPVTVRTAPHSISTARSRAHPTLSRASIVGHGLSAISTARREMCQGRLHARTHPPTRDLGRY